MGIIKKIEEKLAGDKPTTTDALNTTNDAHASSTHPTTGSSNLNNPTSTSATGHGTSGITGGTTVGEGSHLTSHNQKHDDLTGSHGAQHASTTSALPGSHSSNVRDHTLNPSSGHRSTGIVGGHGQDSHVIGGSQQQSGMPGSFPAEHTSTTSAVPHGTHSSSTHTGSHIPGTSTTGSSTQQGGILPGQHSNSNVAHAPSGIATTGHGHDSSILPGHGRDNVVGSHTSHGTAGQTGLTGPHNNTTSGLRNESHVPHAGQTPSTHHTGTIGHSYDNTTSSTHDNHSSGGMSGLLNKIPGVGHKHNDKHAHDSHSHTSTRGPEEGVGGHHVSSSNSADHGSTQHRKSSVKPVSGPHATLENHTAVPTAGGVKVGDGPFEQDRSYNPTAKTAHITSDASGSAHPAHGHGQHTGPDNRGLMDKAKDTLSSKRTNQPDDPITGTNFDQKNTSGLTGSNQTHGLPGQSTNASHGGLTGTSHIQSGHSGLNDPLHSGLSSGAHGQTQHSQLGSPNVHQGGLNGVSHGGLSSNNHGQTQHSGLGHSSGTTSVNQPLAHDQSFAERHIPGVGNTTGTIGNSASNPVSSHNQSQPAAGGVGSNTGALGSNEHYPSSNIPQVQTDSHDSTGDHVTTHGTQSHSTIGGVGSSNPLSSTHDNVASGGYHQAGYNDAMARQQADQSRRL